MPTDITQVLLGWEQDRSAALGQLIPVVYTELRKIAASLMRGERSNHTLQPTAVINEVYLRMVRQDVTSWKDRAHFFGVAARLMRQILVDHARAKQTKKRGGDVRSTAIGEIPGSFTDFEGILDLDRVLSRMSDWDIRKQQVLELHYFGGLKAEEISEALELSLPTVRRDLVVGRAWLRQQLGDAAAADL